MNQRVALFFLLCFSLLIPFRTLAQRSGNNSQAGLPSSTAVLTGTVYGEGNRPVMQALVQLCDGGGNMLAQEITTDNGDFSFRGLERNNYILQVSADNFAPTSTSVNLSYNSERGVPIYLKATSSTDTNEGVASAKISAHELSIPKAARDAFAAGRKKMYVDKNAQGALADFQAAVAAAPDYYEAFHQMALVELDLGKSADAETHLRKAIEVSGDKYGEADVSLGTILLNRGESAEGEKALRRGIELSPNFWLGYYELGRVLLNQEKLAEALKSAEQARSLSPGTAINYRLLSNIHLREKDYSALLEDIDAYIKLDPDSPAGIRAKALREQVAQKVSAQGTPGSKP